MKCLSLIYFLGINVRKKHQLRQTSARVENLRLSFPLKITFQKMFLTTTQNFLEVEVNKKKYDKQ